MKKKDILSIKNGVNNFLYNLILAKIICGFLFISILALVLFAVVEWIMLQTGITSVLLLPLALPLIPNSLIVVPFLGIFSVIAGGVCRLNHRFETARFYTFSFVFAVIYLTIFHLMGQGS